MGRRDVQAELLHEARQSRRLTLRQVEDEARERGRVDDRMLERALESATDQPCVERIVAVLHEHRAVRETQERPPGILELRRTDEHRAVDVMPPARVGVDRGAAVDKRVEKRKRVFERETLSAYLEDEKWGVAGRLDVERDELRVVEVCLPADFGGINRDLFPRHKLAGAPRLEIELLRRGAHRASARARRAQAISSPLSARSSNTATA